MKNTVLVGGLDIGTSGCKLVLYDESGSFVRDAYAASRGMNGG